MSHARDKNTAFYYSVNLNFQNALGGEFVFVLNFSREDVIPGK
jgi:hypothetical protein